MGSSSKLLKLTILFCAALGLRGDSITTYTLTATDSQRCSGYGGPWGPCAPLVFDVPQSLLTLGPVSFSFTDQQTFTWGINIAAGPPQIPVTVTNTLSANSSDIPELSAQYVYTASFFTNGQQTEILPPGGGYPERFTDTLTSSGFTDPTQFEGSGVVPISIQIGLQSSAVGAGAVSAITNIADNATLTITETDPSPVPEPRWTVLLLIAVVALVQRLHRAGLDDAG